MKTLFSSILLSLITSFLLSQSPQSIPYQAVVRNADGSFLSNASLTMIFKIHTTTATGEVVYQESHSTASNAQGLVVLNVGQGQPSVGIFNNINWGNGAKFLHVLMNAGNGELDLGTQQMMSVPYALYAEKSGGSVPTGSAPGELMYWNGEGWSSIPPGGYGKPLCMCDGVPSWGGCVPKLGSIQNIESYSILPSSLNLPEYYYFNFNMQASIISFGTPEISTSNYASYAYVPAGIEISTDSLFLENVTNMGGWVSTQYGISFFINTMGANLHSATTYYLRAFCRNNYGTGYSPVETFITPSGLIAGCMDINACNYNSLANVYNNNTCVYTGSPCDDNDANTSNDVYDYNCQCIGTP
jgi:hypothetical protein